tara:strand:+ start:256 stop:453 length:198 start_codon:yes stop_codon:yes gene_type:complete
MVWCVDVDGCVVSYIGPVNVKIEMIPSIFFAHPLIYQNPNDLIGAVHRTVFSCKAYDGGVKPIGE